MPMSDSRGHHCAQDDDPPEVRHERSHDDTASPRVVNSAALLDGRSQLAILHNETVYFLRQTRFGKLILTK
jgi:hemin uptake protein HemP